MKSWEKVEYEIEKYLDDVLSEDISEMLTLKQVGEGAYRPYNTRTGRYHSLELGIDIV